eukprot:gene5287-3792_t
MSLRRETLRAYRELYRSCLVAARHSGIGNQEGLVAYISKRFRQECELSRLQLAQAVERSSPRRRQSVANQFQRFLSARIDQARQLSAVMANAPDNDALISVLQVLGAGVGNASFQQHLESQFMRLAEHQVKREERREVSEEEESEQQNRLLQHALLPYAEKLLLAHRAALYPSTTPPGDDGVSHLSSWQMTEAIIGSRAGVTAHHLQLGLDQAVVEIDETYNKQTIYIVCRRSCDAEGTARSTDGFAWNEDTERVEIAESDEIPRTVFVRSYLSQGARVCDSLEHEAPLHRSRKTVLVGHGSGGAVALVVSMLLLHRGFTINNVITFGAPKALQGTLERHVASINPIRVVLAGDPIVDLPVTGAEGDPLVHVGEILLLSPDITAVPLKNPDAVASHGPENSRVQWAEQQYRRHYLIEHYTRHLSSPDVPLTYAEGDEVWDDGDYTALKRGISLVLEVFVWENAAPSQANRAERKREKHTSRVDTTRQLKDVLTWFAVMYHGNQATSDCFCADTNGKPPASAVQECVLGGADFMAQCPRQFMPFLHHFVFSGLSDCVTACLTIPFPIDFSITNNKWERSVFHCVCAQNNPSTATEILTMLLARLGNHPEDIVDWTQTDTNEETFLSSVAHHQQLSSLWPLIKTVPYFGSGGGHAIRVAWKHDWEALGEERNQLIVGELISASSATLGLIQACKSSTPAVHEVQRCVDNNADVCFWDLDMNKPLLHHLIENSHVECVAACLTTRRPIDFTAGDDWGWTPLHFVCPKRVLWEAAAEMMRLMVWRIETHPADVVQWTLVSHDGYDILSCAAKYQKLSCIWPLISHMAEFADHVDPFPLQGVWLYDWENLGGDQEYFTVNPSAIVRADRVTADLVRHCELHPSDPDEHYVRESVQRGADICFTGPEMNKPLLHHFIVNGFVECTASCLDTERPIDFTIAAEYGWTPLHYLCVHNTEKAAEVILTLILDRLKRCPQDPVDWRFKDEDGHDFISYAANYRKLSVLWPLLKKAQLPAYQIRGTGVIQISLPADRNDWEKLVDDQRFFELKKGFWKHQTAHEKIIGMSDADYAAGKPFYALTASIDRSSMIHLCSSEAKAAFVLLALVLLYLVMRSSVQTCWITAAYAVASVGVCRCVARGSVVTLSREPPGSSRVAVVTGASSGVGYAVAEALSLAGWKVIITGPNVHRLLLARKKIISKHNKMKKGGEVFVLDSMNLSDESSIRQFSLKMYESERVLPVSLVVNAAGVLHRSLSYPEPASSWWGVESMIATNAVGPMLFSLLMIPMLQRSAVSSGKPSRIINVASSCHTFLSARISADPIQMLAGLHTQRARDLGRMPDDMEPLLDGREVISRYCVRSFNGYNYVNYYGLSKLCTIWNTHILARRCQQLRAPGKILTACVHPGVICTHLYRDLLPLWVLDSVLYYPSLILGKSWKESAFSTLRAIAATEEEFVDGGYYLCDGDHSGGRLSCLSSHASNKEEERSSQIQSAKNVWEKWRRCGANQVPNFSYTFAKQQQPTVRKSNNNSAVANQNLSDHPESIHLGMSATATASLRHSAAWDIYGPPAFVPHLGLVHLNHSVNEAAKESRGDSFSSPRQVSALMYDNPLEMHSNSFLFFGTPNMVHRVRERLN